MTEVKWKTVGYASLTSSKGAIKVRIFFRTNEESEHIDVYLPVDGLNKLMNGKQNYIKVNEQDGTHNNKWNFILLSC